MGKRIFRPPFKVGYNGGAGQCFYVYDASGARVSTEFRPSSADADELARILNAGVAALTKPAALPKEGEEAIRARAFEEAARVADSERRAAEVQLHSYDSYGGPELSGRKASAQRAGAAKVIADRIRALSSLPVRSGEVGGDFVAGGCWQIDDPDEPYWTAEVQIIGGHDQAAVIHAATEEEACHRRDIVARALNTAALATPQQVNDHG